MSLSSASWSVTAPGGRLRCTLLLDDEQRLLWSATLDGRPVVAASRLGLRRADTAFDAGLEMTDLGAVAPAADHVVLPHGRSRTVVLDGHQRTLALRNPDGHELLVDVVVTDDAVALRYRMTTGDGELRVEEELTEVTPAAPGRAWAQATQAPGLVAPAYENPYTDGVPIGTATHAASWDLPACFGLDTGDWLLVAETDVDAGFRGSRLGARPDGLTYRFTGPQPGEAEGIGDVVPAWHAPWVLPWRVVVAGDRPGALVESDALQALARPTPLTDTSWVRPGRAAWSWWSDPASPRDLAVQRDYVDLAAELGWEYVLVDANWDVHPEDDVAALVGYARERGVGIWLWYNSGGPHNRVGEAPRDRMHLPEVRRAEMAKVAGWGVAGLKVDFFHSDKQAGIALFTGILADAARARLMVNFHGCTWPRGWTRTWPHLMSMEGVRGEEFYLAEEGYPEQAARHHTHLVFTRNAVGPADATPVALDPIRFPRVTTYAHELAMATVLESGVLHVAASAAALRATAPPVRAYLRAVPAAWDEVRVLAGEPGHHVVLARRDGDRWFVAAVNGTTDPVEVGVDLATLAPGAGWSVLRDADAAVAGADRDAVAAGHVSDGLQATLAPRGGLVAWTA